MENVETHHGEAVDRIFDLGLKGVSKTALLKLTDGKNPSQ